MYLDWEPRDLVPGGSLCTIPVSIGQFAFSGNHFLIHPTGSWVAVCWPEQLSSCGAVIHPSAAALCWGRWALCGA